jgi:hypothetical protein
MTPDLRDGEARPTGPPVDDDERRDAESRVAWYFGDLLDTVTAEYPVARHRLVVVLATLEAAARGQASLVDDRSDPVGTANAPGRVVRLPLQLWTVLRETEDLTDDELRAGRAVHRRMAVALTGEDPDPAAPFFVFAAESPY